jgi:hypothetical protein
VRAVGGQSHRDLLEDPLYPMPASALFPEVVRLDAPNSALSIRRRIDPGVEIAGRDRGDNSIFVCGRGRRETRVVWQPTSSRTGSIRFRLENWLKLDCDAQPLPRPVARRCRCGAGRPPCGNPQTVRQTWPATRRPFWALGPQYEEITEVRDAALREPCALGFACCRAPMPARARYRRNSCSFFLRLGYGGFILPESVSLGRAGKR